MFFTSHTIHAGVKTDRKQGGIYSSHVRMFAYIVEHDYVQTTDSIPKWLSNDKYILSCATCESLFNENIYYEGHIIRYLKSQCNIYNLPMVTVLLGHLENVGWVVFKCDYTITANSKEYIYFYDLNNKSKKNNIVGIIYIKQIVKLLTILMRISMNKILFKIWTFNII